MYMYAPTQAHPHDILHSSINNLSLYINITTCNDVHCGKKTKLLHNLVYSQKF